MDLRLWHRLRFKNLLFWLLAYLMIGPLIINFPYAKLLLEISLSAVFVFAISAVSREKRILFAAVILMICSLIAHWINRLEIIHGVEPLSHFITIMYLGILVYNFFLEILKSQKVTTDLIAATLCLYLITGLLWGNLYMLLESLSPGSFSGNLFNLTAGEPAREGLHTFIYFSYITLTTLGYGDMTPQTPGAMVLCQAEAIFGQFFIAVLVARLVGIQASQQIRVTEGDGDS